MVALKEERSPESLADSRGQDGGGILGRALVGVAYLAAGNLENEGAGVDLAGGAKDGPGRIVGQHPEIDGRHGEPRRNLAPALGFVEIEDGSRADAQGLGGFADDPAGGGPGFGVAEDGFADEAVHPDGQGGGIGDGQPGPVAGNGAGQGFKQAVERRLRHEKELLEKSRWNPSVYQIGRRVRYRRRSLFLRPRMPPLRKRPAPMTNPKLYQPPLLWTS